MITKYITFNESIKSLLVGPSKKEVLKYFGYDETFDTPEEFFLNLIHGMKIKKQTKYLHCVYWEKNDKIIFIQDFRKNKILFVEYYSIWSVFKNIFGLNYDETQRFIKDQVKEHLNWKGFTTVEEILSKTLGWKNI